jgi:hypothetical protein
LTTSKTLLTSSGKPHIGRAKIFTTLADGGFSTGHLPIQGSISKPALILVTKDGYESSNQFGLFKVEPATLTLRDTFKVDLPCRLFEVGWGKPTTESHPLYGAPSSCTLLYALGASYTGDGSPVNDNQYKTHLYKIAIRD